MPTSRAVLVVVLSLGPVLARAADEFPYTAYVAVAGAEVVAGPGQRYYATDHLPRGAAIEIYREEPSGWLAIRPPDGSFSWIPATAIERSAEDRRAGRVTSPAPAWIGTAVEHVDEHRQQVTLKEGELVQILGEKQVAGEGDKAQTWLKIEPPAGEFRWIHLRDVSRQLPPEPEPEIVAADTAAVETAAAPRPAEPRRLEAAGSAIALQDIEQPAARRLPSIERAQFQSSSGSGGAAAQPLSPDGFVARKRPSENLQPATPAPPLATAASPLRARTATERVAPAAVATRPAREAVLNAQPPGVAAADLAEQLERIELDLSLMVAQDKSLWDLKSIEKRIHELVERGGDPAGRGRARLLLEKVEQFEQAFAVQNYGTIRTAAAQNASKPAASALDDPRYDAQGWLKPTASSRGGKPLVPYAIVDENHQPICFVTPQPGLNLREFENKRVGVYGRRGYIEELKKPHVTAREIVPLDKQWR